MRYIDRRTTIEAFKATASVADYLRANGIDVPRTGTAINVPPAIRQDRHPSFVVYDAVAIDMATRISYDIVKLDMILHNRDFRQSFTALTGLDWPEKDYQQHVKAEEKKRLSLTAYITACHRCLVETNPEVYRNAQNRRERPLDYLHSRFLTDEFIAAQRIGYDEKQQRIIFPYWDETGTIPMYYAGRDFSGRAELSDEDPNKYEYISGNKVAVPKYKKPMIEAGCDQTAWGLESLKLGSAWKVKKESAFTDVLESVTPAESLKNGTLVIVEGAVDACVFRQHGWQVVSGLGGDFRKAVAREIVDTARTYKNVFICFDNDAAGCGFQRKWMVRFFQERVSFICGHTAPDGTGKFDVADYYKAACERAQCAGRDTFTAGEEALLKLVREATPGIQELAGHINSLELLAQYIEECTRYVSNADLMLLKTAIMKRVNPETGFPFFHPEDVEEVFKLARKRRSDYENADEIIQYCLDTRHPLTYIPEDSFYQFNGTHWNRVHDLVITNLVALRLGKKSNFSSVSSVRKAISSRCVNATPFNMRPVFALKNCTLNFEHAGTDHFAALPHPDYRVTFHVNYNYNSEAECPQWEKFIREICANDEAMARELQKACGSVFIPSNREQGEKLFYFYGKGANGKSVFMKILSEVLGTDNCSFLRPDRLATEFDPIVLRSSIANFCFEAKRSLKGAEEQLKAAVSGDPMHASYKCKDTISFAPRAKWFISMNNFFNSEDVSDGFLRRFVMFPFSQSFEPGDLHLEDKLRRELPGILNWCVKGYMLLKEEGFKETERQAKLRRKFEEHIEPLKIFLDEMFSGNVLDCKELAKLVLGIRGHIKTKELFEYYKHWCAEFGCEYENRGVFNDRLEYLAPRIVRDEGLGQITVKRIRKVWTIIIPELDDEIAANKAVSRELDAKGSVNASEVRERVRTANEARKAGSEEVPLTMPEHEKSAVEEGYSIEGIPHKELGALLPEVDEKLLDALSTYGRDNGFALKEQVLDRGDAAVRQMKMPEESRNYTGLEDYAQDYYAKTKEAGAALLWYQGKGDFDGCPIEFVLRLFQEWALWTSRYSLPDWVMYFDGGKETAKMWRVLQELDKIAQKWRKGLTELGYLKE